MPILRKKADGSHYIRTTLFGSASFVTYQLSDEGSAFLSLSGVKVDDTFSSELLERLRNLGYAFTNGGGVQPVLPEQQAAARFDSEERKQGHPRLAIQFTDDGWEPVILFPELPKEWNSDARLLAKCDFLADGRVINATALWIGRGGAAAPVSPHTRAYQIKAVGGWPKEWDLRDWTMSIPGLDEAANLFHCDEEGSVRLETGESLIRGNEYIFVSFKAASNVVKATKATPPQSLNPTPLGRYGDWRAVRLRIPEFVDAALFRWTNEIGRTIDDPAGTFQLLSPAPTGYSMQGLAHVEVGSTAVIQVSWPQIYGADYSPQFHLAQYDLDTWAARWLRPLEVVRRNDGAAFVALELTEIGAYKLESLTDGFRPLRFLVSDSGLQAGLTVGAPEPLSMAISFGEEARTLQSFVEKGLCELRAVPRSSVAVQLHVHEAARLYYERRDYKGNLLKREGSVKDIQEALTADLQALVDGRRRCSFVLDAGAFGRLSAAVEPRRTEPPGASLPGVLSPKAAKRALWLSQAISAHQHDERHDRMVVPVSIRRKLNALEKEYPGLRNLTLVPRSLWPHLLRLAVELPVESLKRGADK